MSEPTPVDPEQLRRIEKTHRGFLYQHLVGVALLFQLAQRSHEAVVVERDEDLEVVRTGERWYLQVKNYSHSLTPSVLADTFCLFDELRSKHASGDRDGSARFFVVSSSEPGPKLLKQMNSDAWPPDVEFVSPERV